MAETNRAVLVLVGGFLGAGKTTLILRAASILREQGLRVAVITNDQDNGLVDTMLSQAESFETREVAGGCFCCRFSDLIDASSQLDAYKPDVIFAEPVGSCLDISATIIQPLKAYHADRYRVAPFTVLVDPELARKVFSGQADADVSYLFTNQLTEADIVCVTKTDRYAELPGLPVPVEASVSAITGEGVKQWLDAVLDPGRAAGTHLLDVDYQRYADAEAALGWVNVHAEIELLEPLSAPMVVGPALDEIDARLTAIDAAIAHLKVFDQTPSGYVKASICANGDEPDPEGDLLAAPETRHQLVVNLRAIGSPDELKEIVFQVLNRLSGTISIRHAGAFRPSPPKPEHRFAERTV